MPLSARIAPSAAARELPAVAREAGDELRAGTDEAGVGEVEDGPEVAEAVLDRRAGERTREWRDAAQLLRGLAGGVLDRLRLVEHHARPVDAGDGLDVAHRGAVGGDDDVGVGDLGGDLVGGRGSRRGAR